MSLNDDEPETTGRKLSIPLRIRGITFARHPAQVFSFLDVFSPCVTYNHYNTFQWFRPRVKKLEEAPHTLPQTKWRPWGSLCCGVRRSRFWKFFERTDVPSLHAAEPVLNGGPLVHADARIPLEVTRSLWKS